MLKARRDETEVPLSLALTRTSGPVTGATVLVAIRDGNTQDSYLDFDDDTFKTVGWTTRQAAVADIGSGFYARSGGLDVGAITNLPAATEILVAEYEVTAPSNSTGVALENILLEEFVDDLNDLAQSDILSDATPFDGADIAAILFDTGTSIPLLIAALNDLSLADIDANTFDGERWDVIVPILLAMAAGRIEETSPDVFDFFERDNTTVLFTLTKTATERTRS